MGIEGDFPDQRQRTVGRIAPVKLDAAAVFAKDGKMFSRQVVLTVTYNFNQKRSKYRGTGAGEDEKSRF